MIKVLVAEDDEAIRRALVDELVIEKFSVTEAVDGLEALEKTISGKPDLVVLDMVLPKMNGIEVFKKIRAYRSVENTKVIMFTNVEADNAMIAEMNELKPCFYLNKASVRVSELAEKIKSVFRPDFGL